MDDQEPQKPDPLITPALDPQYSEPVTISLTEEELRRSPEERRLREREDGIQHGIDDDSENDATKGAGIGAAGGALVGGAAGALLGPAGIAVGAVAGAILGATASGLAVAAVDSVDNDDNVTGLGAEVRVDPTETLPPGVNERVREERTGL